MCGIAGWVDCERDLTAARRIIAAMSAALAPRGPDDDGLWASPRAALAHRRLAVIDPAGGRQPMIRSRGTRQYVMTYNGELYNTAELRQELESRGHQFLGHSDTEVLLAAYVEWEEDCLERLNGIFAFGIWDVGQERLFLARDRLGVKPLFYAPRGKGLIFGSELKALLAHPAVEPEVTAEGLAEVLVMGPGRTPGHGVFREVYELKPGHWLSFDRTGLRVRRYWQLVSHAHPDSPETTAVRLRELLADAVERQLVADVPICTLLSGGLDSSAITALAAAALAREDRLPLSTYSVDYEENDRYFRPNAFIPSADGPWVQRVAGHLGTAHRTVTIGTQELVAALPRSLQGRDLPGMVDVDASLYLLSAAVRQEATVALSGECADEILGGYPWFRDAPPLENLETFPWMRSLPQRLRLLAPEVIQHLRPRRYAGERYREALAEVPALPGEEAAAARRRAIGYLTLTRWMPVLLERKDRMSMAVGLEVRVPFCDHRLVAYAWNIPWAYKQWGGQEKGNLRRALAGVLPADVLARRKSPYPKSHHPAYAEALRVQLQEVLADSRSPLLPLIDRRAVAALAAVDPETPETTGFSTGFSAAWFGQLMGLPQLWGYLVQVNAWLRDYRVRLC